MIEILNFILIENCKLLPESIRAEYIGPNLNRQTLSTCFKNHFKQKIEKRKESTRFALINQKHVC